MPVIKPQTDNKSCAQ